MTSALEGARTPPRDEPVRTATDRFERAPASATTAAGLALITASVTALATIALWAVVPLALGWRPVTLTSGSMQPHLHAGDVVFYDPHPGRIPVGAIVTYRAPGGTLITHRVVSASRDGTLRTKGDSNRHPDPQPVRRSQVLGRARLVVPRAGQLARHPALLLVVVGAPLGGMALLAFSSGTRRRRPKVRRRAEVAIAASIVVAIVATGTGAGLAAFSATTANTSNSFSTLFTPNSAPDSLSAQLATNGTIYAEVISSNTLYVGGDFTAVDGTTRNRLAAFDLNSNTLTSWNPNVNNNVYSLAVDATNNLVYAGGAFTTVNGATTRNRIAAFSTTTATATAWNPSITGGTVGVQALALDVTNSLLYTAGDFTAVGGTARNYLAAISTASGSPSAWNPNVASGTQGITSIALDTTNSLLYAGGDFTSVNGGTTRDRLAAFSTATGAANSWDPNVSSGAVFALALDSTSGLMYVGGSFTTSGIIGSFGRNYAAAIQTSTGEATTWDPNFNNTVRALALDPTNGIVYAGGSFTTSGSLATTRNRIAAISVATYQATPWNPNADSTVDAIALDAANSRVAFGGAFAAVTGADRQSVAVSQLASTTNPDAPISTAIDTGTTGAIRAELLSGTTLYLGGDFTWINGSARKHLASIDLTTGNLTSWNPGADNTVRAFALDTTNNVLYAGGDFYNVNGSYRPRLASFSTVDGSLTSWVSSTGPTVDALAVDPANSVLYVGGTFTSGNLTLRSRLEAVSTTTGIVTSWNPNMFGNVQAMVFDSANSLLYVGGAFTGTAGGTTTRNRIAALSTTTGLATSFDPNVNNAVHALALDTTNGVLYAGGDFTTVNNGASTRNYLAAFSTATGTATAWNPNANNSVYALSVDVTNSALYASGSFTALNGGTTRNRLAAISTATGTVTAWNPNLNGTTTYSLAVDVAGGIAYAGGDFTTAAGANRSALAAITNAPAGAAAAGTLSITSAGNLGIIYAMTHIGSVVYISGSFIYVAGQVRNHFAAIDTSNNTLTSWNPNANNYANQLIADGTNNLVYAIGTFTTINGATTRNYAAAISTVTGTVTSWNPNLNNIGFSLALDSTNGIMYLAGNFTTVAGTARNYVAAVSTATGVLTAFNPNFSSWVYFLVLDGTNGALYTAGNFTTVNGGTTRNYLAALSTANGTATSWNPNMSAATYALSLDSTNGLIYAGGSFTTIGGTTRNRLAAISTSTGTVNSWSPNVNNVVYFTQLDTTNGVLYAGGNFSGVGSLTRNRLVAISTGASTPLAWNPNLSGTTTWVLDLTATSVIAGGDFQLSGVTEVGCLGLFGLAVPDATMSYSLAAHAVSNATTPNVNAMVLNGSTLYIGGDFTSVGGTPRRRLAAWDLGTNTLLSWNPSANAVVNSMAIDSTNNLMYVGGGFSSLSFTTTRNFLGAVSTSNGTVTSWDPNMNNTVSALALDLTNGLVYAGGAFTTVNGGTARNRIAALSTATATASPWDGNMNNAVSALALDLTNGLVYAGGSFTTVNNGGAARNRIVALSTSTATASAWDGNMNGTVRSLVLDSTNGIIYAGGDFTTVNNGGATRNRLAALSTSTATATAWNPNMNNSVYALANDQVGTLYAVGTFTTVNGGTARNRAAALSTSTGTATSWNPNLNSSAWTLGLGVGHLAIGGTFTTANGGTARVCVVTYIH
jgi:signal peptidase I